MLKAVQDFAIKKLKESGDEYKIISTFIKGNKIMSDKIKVKKIPKVLKQKGFYLSVKPNKKGYYRLYQPPIEYTVGQSYGFIPKGFLEN
ncbi:hypothetical protein [Aquimarina longa]|uniref:hypothetical protein n=1 Tax=Aquimarina longa TaxID=1080221 RepID=UPI000783310B|nr:hypothetical protein [Aquimarina longa]